MKYTQELIKRILKERGLSEIEHQLNFLEDIQIKGYEKPYVLGAGPSSGKTEMCLLWAEGFYSIKENLKKRTIIVPASKVILRDNFEDRLKSFNPSFKYFVITSDLTKEEFKRIIKDEQYQVIVCLPHALNNNIESLVKFDNFVLDEAHEWYFAKHKTANDLEPKKGVVFKILKKIDPTIQLLLTGTPSKFIAEKEKFNFFFVTGMELFDAGLITNVQVEIVSSHLDFSPGSYKSPFGDLKSSISHSKKDSKRSMEEVCLQMIKKLNNPNKGFLGSLGHTLNNSVLDNSIGSIGKMFCILEKTMVICHRQDQANEFDSVLNSFGELKGKVLTSHSDNDTDNSNFNEFQNNPDIKVLIVVNRGRLGFNMKELFNIVDFSYSKNLDLLYQMIARLFRKSSVNPGRKKIFYKVAPSKTAIFFQDIMTAVLCLMRKEWYTRFNGKNMGDIEIPRPRRIRTSGGGKPGIKGNSKFTPISWEELEIPQDLNLFKNSPLYSKNDSFSSISFTTLAACRKEFMNINKSGDEIKDRVLSLYHNGEMLSNSQIAKIIGTIEFHVNQIIIENGLKSWADTKNNNGRYRKIEEIVLSAYHNGNMNSVKEISDITGIHHTQINEVLANNSLENWTDIKYRELEKKVLEINLSGFYSSIEIADMVSTNIGNVCNILMRNNQKTSRSSMLLKVERDVIDLYNNGKEHLTTEIAEILKITNSSASSILQRHKLKSWGSIKAERFKKEVIDFYIKNSDKSARQICILMGYDPGLKCKMISNIIKELKSK